MTENLDELRKTAEAATPGPWRWSPEESHWGDCGPNLETVERGPVYADGSQGALLEVIGSWGHDANGISVADEDKDFIATFDPTTVLALLNRLEQAEQKVASLEAKMDGENLRWVAWEMVENSGHLDLPIVTWINRISDDEVSLDAAKYFFFGGKSPCIHLDSDEPFDIGDEDRHACEHCNRRALDGES